MPAPANLSFETAGASAGLAASWTTTITATEDVADFDDGSGVPKGIEDYSYGWPGFPLDTTIGIGSATATFDETFITPPKTIEQYDRWQAATFRIDLTGGIAAQFDGALTMEDYSFGWQTGSFTSEFAPGPPDVFEDYDTGWPGDPYQTEITLGGGGTEGRFDTPLGTVAIESYEHTFADVPFVVDLSNNIFVCDTPHGLTSNQKGEVISTGKRPGGVPSGAHIFVIFVSTTTFRVSAAPGPGSPVTLTDVGFGDHVFKADKTKYWTDVS